MVTHENSRYGSGDGLTAISTGMAEPAKVILPPPFPLRACVNFSNKPLIKANGSLPSATTQRTNSGWLFAIFRSSGLS